MAEATAEDATAERLDRFMARAAAAYYARPGRDPFGARGDFTTAPEITQAFGECLGLWCVVAWRAMGRPARVVLAELGPGRGTLMADALRAARGAEAGFAAAVAAGGGPHLVETSPTLCDAQRARVPDATHHEDARDLPPGPLLLLANEFLDALPVRQFERRGSAWRERWVAGGGRSVLRDPEPGDAPDLPTDAPEGEVREVGEAAGAVVSGLAARAASEGGAALFVDYGPARSGPGDTLQAVRAHAPADPLATPPGEADLTAHVDFAALAAVARAAGAAVHGPVPQGLFLRRLGLTVRAAALAASDPRRGAEHLAAAQRLTAPEAMGRIFKAMAVAHPALPVPPGFEGGGGA